MQSDQSNVDRQYLKAMGIDLWVERDAEELSVPAVSNDAVTSDSAVPVRQWSADQLQQSLALLQVESCASNQAELLVVTEGSAFSDSCAELLGTMLNAIKIDASQWVRAGTMAAANQSMPLASAVNTVNPKAVVLMARSDGAAHALDALRGVQHQLQGITPFVVTTFHPQDLLDNPEIKRPAWEDLKQLRQWLT